MPTYLTASSERSAMHCRYLNSLFAQFIKIDSTNSITMNLTASKIFDHFKEQGLIIDRYGPDNPVTGVAAVGDCGNGDLVFLDGEKYIESVHRRSPSVVVTSNKFANKLKATDTLAILVASNVKLASALVKQRYFDRDLYQTEWGSLHGSAVIDESASIAKDTVIGPGVVVGARACISRRAVIMANSVVEHDAVIGERSVVHPHCVIGYGCEIGKNVILKSGCVIGSEGFGFAQDEYRHHHRIPQLGKVVIEDRVSLGANCTIDRATFKETRIKAGCIIDALCHVAHNVSLGEDCILCAQTVIAGSSRFGKRVVASGQTGVLDHVSVPDDTVLLHRAGVINSLKKSGVYAATPPQPFKEYVRNIAIFRRLGEMWTRLRLLEKQVEKLSR